MNSISVNFYYLFSSERLLACVSWCLGKKQPPALSQSSSNLRESAQALSGQQQ